MECGWAAKRAGAATPDDLRARARSRYRVKKEQTQRYCLKCAAPLYVPNVHLCEACKGQSAYQPKPRLTKPCVGCGEAITGTAAKRLCVACVVKGQRVLRKARGRARHYGVEYQRVDPIKVFERDRWRCQVCGVKTPRRLRGTGEPNAPELDHRIPVSRGGGHTWANVQCCCRSCNGLKGATVVLGQMHLFPDAA